MPRRRRPNSGAARAAVTINSTSSSPSSSPSLATPAASGGSSAVHNSRPLRVSASSSRPITRTTSQAASQTSYTSATVPPPPGFEDRTARRSRTLGEPSRSSARDRSPNQEQDGLEWGHLLPRFQLDSALDESATAASRPSVGVIGDRRGSAPEVGRWECRYHSVHLPADTQPTREYRAQRHWLGPHLPPWLGGAPPRRPRCTS